MEANLAIESVNIRPGVAILSVLQHLNYKPWFAISEFVDNSLQSFLDYKDAILAIEGRDFRLRVEIEIDPAEDGRIIIRDNAAGIHQADYARAFRPAALPMNQNGLCEFGMGMKSAACWFADNWTVRTSALGEYAERAVTFDVNSIVQDSLEELVVNTRGTKPEVHFTEITLSKLHKAPYGRTLGKIKEHLASIYRIYLRDQTLELCFDGDLLSFPSTPILNAPYFKDPSGTVVEWRKDIDFDFGLGMRVKGVAALRERASTTHAGFALFRRNRLVQGSADESYRPELIFSKPNSYAYQRLFGELELEGFEISHTKDGFRWDENEEEFLELLREHLAAEPLPLLSQAESYRARLKPDELRKGAETAARRTAEAIEQELPPVLEKQIHQLPDFSKPPHKLSNASALASRVIDVELAGNLWQITLELSDDPGVSDWVSIFDQTTSSQSPDDGMIRKVGVRLALSHPFTERFGGTEASDIEPLLRIAAAIGLAETAARDSGVRQAGTMRRNINDLLRNALSKA